MTKLVIFVCLHLMTLLFSSVQAVSHPVQRYYNCRVVLNHALDTGELWVAGGKIISPQSHADEEIDVKGEIIAPGYIDLQINGAFGVDFSHAPNLLKYAAQRLPQYGVTAFLPTVISSTSEQYASVLPHLQPRPGGAHGAEIIGIHLEGPFFNPSQHGAHDPLKIAPIITPLEAYYGSLKGVKMVTLAPEIPHALDAVKELVDKNIVVSGGHTLATYEETCAAIDAGMCMATHLFNAMTPFHHRQPGFSTAILTHEKVFFSVIADGHHVHPAALKQAWKCHPQGLVLITDAMEALGQPPGIYHLGDMTVEVGSTAAHILGTQTLAGSILSMDKAVRFLQTATDCTLVEALEAASLRPAQLLGIQSTKGTLNEGADADFIILDDQLHVQACYVAGSLAWKNND